MPIYYNHPNTGRPISEEKYTSKYLYIENTPLFPFGYGLSYTQFAYSDITLDKSNFGRGQQLKASIRVTNSGPYDGEEVVQLYIQDLVASVVRPVKELKAFKKVMIPSGVSKEILFTIGQQDLAFYKADMSYGVEAGDFKVYIGTNSQNVKEASFRFDDTITLQDRVRQY